MKILVTGGTGFTGSHLTRRLLQKGHHVVVLDIQPGLFFDELQQLGAEIHIGSVTDRNLVAQIIRDCTVVHHVAAMFRKVNLPKQTYWDVNVEGTRALLQIAAESGVEKFVYCSTCGVHGNVGREPVDETAPIAPADYYQYTKYQGERVALEFLGKGPQIVILRPTAIYGPGDPERFLKLFRLVQRGRFFMFGDGQVFYHPVYIDNLIDAFELAVSSGRGNGEAYLIGDEHYYTLDALVLAIAKTLHLNPSIRHLPFWPLWLAAVTCELLYKPLRIDPPLFRRRVDWFRQNRAFRIEKAKKELGYTPRVDLPNGLAQTAQWYRTHGYLS